jgi:hypothetical protein
LWLTLLPRALLSGPLTAGAADAKPTAIVRRIGRKRIVVYPGRSSEVEEVKNDVAQGVTIQNEAAAGRTRDWLNIYLIDSPCAISR